MRWRKAHKRAARKGNEVALRQAEWRSELRLIAEKRRWRLSLSGGVLEEHPLKPETRRRIVAGLKKHCGIELVPLSELREDPKNPRWSDRQTLILSKPAKVTQ